MRLYLLIALGGALGAVLRYFLNGVIAPHVSDVDGWIPILVINVTGSALIGLIFAATGPDGRWFASPATRLFLMTGICGGYTTFSSFSLQTLNLVRDGYALRAAVNVAGSVALCLLGVWLGFAAGALLNQSR